MKKEVLIAVILGLLVGGVITYGVYTARQAVLRSREKVNQASPMHSIAPTPQPDEVKQTMQIESPLEGTLYTNEIVEMKGKTFPGAIVVIFQDEVEHVVEADGSGNFTLSLTLQPGATYLYTVSTSQTGDKEEDKRIVVFSTANLDEKPKQATGSADADVNGTKPNLEGG